MKRFFFRLRPLSLAVLLLASLSLSLLNTSSVNAASAYDTAWNPIDNLEIYDQAYNTCTVPNDITDNFSDTINNVSKWVTSTDYDAYQPLLGETGVKYVIASYVPQTNVRGMYIYATTGDAHLEWSTDHVNLVSTEDIIYYRIVNKGYYYGGSNCEALVWDAANAGTSIAVSYTSGSVRPFEVTGDIDLNLPDDYEGLVPETTGGTQEHLTPYFNYTVNDQEVTISYKGYIPSGGCQSINYIYSKDGGASSEITTLAPNVPYTFTGSGNGTYMILADYNTVPGPCIDGYDFPENTVIDIVEFPIVLNGKSFAGSTSDLVCANEDGVTTCEGNEMPEIFTKLDGYAASTYGLQKFILAPLHYFNSLSGNFGVCSPITLPSVRGFNIEIECLGDRLMDNFPVLVATYQIILTALCFYWVAVKSLRMIRDVQDPQQTRITVMSL